MAEFSQTELDSCWQSLRALPHVTDPGLKRGLFLHALEEARHYQLFRALAKKSGFSEERHFQRNALVSRNPDPEELRAFFAYLHVGEKEVNSDLDVYANLPVDAEARSVFAQIREEEAGHAESSEEFLAKVGAGERGKMRWLLARTKLQRIGKLYGKLMQQVGHVFGLPLMALVYLLAGPIFFGSARRRFRLSAQEENEIFREQILSGARKP